VSPARIRARDYRCNRGPKRRASQLKRNRRRIWIGHYYRFTARTDADTAAIRQHIKERVSAFKGQQDREKAEGAAAG
jgi:hypothetical protein